MRFYCSLISMEKVFFSGFILKINVTGILGQLGIYPGHSHLLTYLKPGLLLIEKELKNKEFIYSSSGILEVKPEKVTIFSDTIIFKKDLNKKLILKEKKNLERKIKNKDFSQNNKNHILNKLQESLEKLKIINMINCK
ncbi:MAG TPA: ATP synthase F1 subunit epsilon [Buchnera sp. (in: enterobacteria)]|nr:ATP synthase F1 subunit epsilon [Buchnera sp. (in: enterobacteria)]